MQLDIDSTTGGNGDIWMRLIGFYAIAGIRKDLKVNILIPAFLRPLARITFGDRLNIADIKTKEMKYQYSNMGLRHIWRGILEGKKYIATFRRSNFKDNKERRFKDYLNIALFSLADNLGLLIVPPESSSQKFHGYMDSASFKPFRNISFEEFSEQVKKDFPALHDRLNGEIPLSPELQIPDDLRGKIVFFANGTSRQFVPMAWAKENYPDAYYAFFYAEKECAEFMQNGLKVIPYYKEPGDLIAIAKLASKVLCTDSFPSHLLQTAKKECTVVITEVIPDRVISPSFEGHVVDSEVSCHPCLHMTRVVPCAAGYFECLNWKNSKYVDNIRKALA